MSEVRYIHLAPGQSPPELRIDPYRAVVVIDEPITADWQRSVSEWLVGTGCLYMMAWGIDCGSWDDSVDYANLEEFDFGDVPKDRFVMTTWHDNEPLSEVFWFAEHAAHHDFIDGGPTVLIDITKHGREMEMRGAFHAAQMTPEA